MKKPTMRDRRGRVRLTIRVDPEGTFREQIDGAIVYYETLGARLDHAAKRAMQHTFLAEFQKLFMQRLYRALQMEVISIDKQEAGGTPQLQQVFAAQRTFIRAMHRLNLVKERGSSKEIMRAQERYKSARASWQHEARKRADGNGSKRSSLLSSGQFRLRASKLLSLITDSSQLKVTRTTQSLKVGAGSFAAIEHIETPSATPMQFGKPTGSHFKNLWRHLEFGTGAHAVNKRHDSWTYPIRVEQMTESGNQLMTIPMALRGTQPMHLLAEITKESRRITADFSRRLTRELHRE